MKGKKIDIEQTTDFPWKGDVTVKVNSSPAETFEIAMRIPCWANNEVLPGNLYSFSDEIKPLYSLKVNGKFYACENENGYAIISRKWEKGDEIQLSLSMETRCVAADKRVKDNIGKVAIMRGPMVYCVEWPESENKHVLNFVLPNESELQTRFKADFLGGVSVIEAKGKSVSKTADGQLTDKPVSITAIPYFTWANRGLGEMAVWLATEDKYAKPLPPPTIASESTISASAYKKSIVALNDGMLPKNSNDHSITYYHWWPENNSTQWIQYDFAKPAEISTVKVYWFDDGPDGGCRIPANWKILYKTGSGDWKEVETDGNYPIIKDEINTINLKKVNASAVKMEIQLSDEFSSGIYEWIVE
jgi:hypothetical protein